jgi:hypothetical protein
MRQKSCWAQKRVGLTREHLIQEVLSVEPIPLGRAEAGVRSIPIALRCDQSRALPGPRKINSKAKGSGQKCPLHTGGGASLRGQPRTAAPNEPCPKEGLIQEVLPIQRISLRGAEAGVADDAAEFFLGGAIVDAGGADYILFKHH